MDQLPTGKCPTEKQFRYGIENIPDDYIKI
jgi:hypothetical protein